MFRFATPEYLYLLLVVPFMVAAFALAARARKRALERFGDPHTLAGLMPEASPRRIRRKFVFVCAALCLVAIGLARPQFGSRLREVTRTGIEMMLAVDVSNSMLA